MLALYHFDRSTAAQKVRLSLAEKGLAWESRIVDPGLDKRDQHTPEYLRLNPRGVVPTLIHDGNVIRESQVILEYLEDAFPAPSLRPAGLADRAAMRIWTKLIDEHLHIDSRTIGQCIATRHLMLTADPAHDLIFGLENARKWAGALRHMGIDPLSLSAVAGRA